MSESETEELEVDVEVIEREHEIDPEVLRRREAALQHVRQYGDPILKTRSAEVTHFDAALEKQIERMTPIMDDSLGTGLAAPQVGVLQRMFVYRLGGEGALKVMVNPEIEWSSRETEVMEEGCLSLSGVHVDVERPFAIKGRAQDATGKEFEFEYEELEARIIQHELDHLDGVLILDRCPRDQRKDAMRILRERE